ncbi:amino acid adenylation domain-containing protein [Streptomyces sp. NPDC001083]|uniref:amino acid adenylation domain-containing protein n=1 Tax=Streptomyces sp. NPDC001083 TaxID=3364545 RepID=UPI00369AD494
MAEQRYAAAFAQQRLWLLQALEPEGTAYHLTEAFRVSGPLDTKALARAARLLCDRHEALRTRFEQVDGAIVQVVTEPGTEQAHPGFRHSKLPAAQGAERETQVARFHRAVLDEPFDLRTGPLLRLHVGEAGPDEHVIAVSAHHIVCDGWSMSVLLGELSALYRAEVLGVPAGLPEPELQYTDYSTWEREWLDEERTEECLRHWRRHLAGAPTVLSLPADRPRRATGFPASGVHEVVIDSAVTERVHALAAATRSTPGVVTLAAFHAFLARITGERDILVGHPVGGRTRAGTESLVGMLVNTLPLRGDVRDDPAFRELVERVRASVLDGQEYAELPFERIVEEINPDRTQGVNPLVQVMFQLLDDGFTPSLELSGTTTRPLHAAQPTTFFDLALDMSWRGGQLHASFNYSRDLFDPDTVAHLADCFTVLLAAATAHPDTPVPELPLLDDAARHHVLHRLGRGPLVDVPADATVLTALAERIAERPDELAVTDGHRELTYRQLGEAVDALAAELAARGIAAGDRVGLLVTRSALLPVGVLGVLRAGAVLVPLDPANPAERLRAMTDEAALRLIVTDSAVRERAARLGPPLLDLHTLRTGPGGTIPPAPGPDDVAYVVFTSGSTATPKGVVVRHGALANLYHSHRASHYTEMAATVPGRRLRVAYTMSVAFDASWDQLLWMVDGHELHVVDDDTARDAVQLLDAVRRRQIDVLEATPSFLEQLVGLGLLAGEHPGPKLFVLGGEAVRPSLWNTLAATPDVIAVNMYGPTEFTVDALVAPVEGGVGPVIGRPLANCAVVVLDPAGRLLPVGVTGEICLSGPQLADGYLDDPARTAKRFVADPFEVVPGGRMYRTGDLGRLRADGRVEFVGRLDGQVKIRGYRVDLGEVESALLACDGLRDAAVVARPDTHGHVRLVGYVVAATRLDQAALRDHLARRLPDYMVPSALVEVDEIPRTVSGKAATAALPELDAAALGAGRYVAPLPGVEERLATIFQEVLDLDRVGRFDDFFQLGGHSLSAVQLISRIRGRFGSDLTLRALFERPTVAGLAGALNTGGERERLIGALGIGEQAVASAAQQRLWVLQQITPGNTGYNMVEAVGLRGPVDVAALARAVETLAARHDVLRSRYALGERQLLVTVDPQWGQEVTLLDLSGSAPAEVRRRAEEYVQEVGRRSYDLEKGPLFEAAVLTLGPDDHLLVLGVHHIVCDGWSVKVVLSELAAHYRDLTAGRTPALPAPELQYQDYAAWERGPEHAARLAADLSYWQEQLAGAPTELALPCDRERPEVHGGRGATVRFRVSPRDTAALAELARSGRTTLFTTLLAAFQVVLARWTGQRDLLVGVPVAGRTRSELEGLIGLFVNILPIRGILDESLPFDAFLSRVHDTVLSGHAHQTAPFEQIVERLNPARDLGLNPLVQVTCQLFENSGAEALDLPGVCVESVPLDVPSSRFDLSLDLTRDGEGLSAELCYDADLYRRSTITDLARAFEAFVHEAGRDPVAPIARLAAPAGGRGVDAGDYAPVAAALKAYPQIQDALVVAGTDAEGRPRPVAHLVPADDIRADDFETFMDSWRDVFECTYVPDPDGAPDAALQGWTDSFSGTTIPPEQMTEWATGTVDRIRALRPRRLLEIGAGTGLLVSPLCREAGLERYVATDYADAAVEMLRQAANGSPVPVVVAQAEALEAIGAAPGLHDTVVLNSVVQYFPSLAYLRKVIERTVAGIEDGGHLFVGDVRNGVLLEAFLSLREHLRQGPSAPARQVAEAVGRALRTDTELSVDPGFFTALAAGHERISAVEIAPRRGRAGNEMALFRYDVVLHVGCATEADDTDWVPDAPATPAEVERRLADHPGAFGYRRIVNARLTEALRLRDLYLVTPEGAGDHGGPGLHPEDLWRLGALHGRTTRIGWAHGDADGTLEISFLAPGARSHYTLSSPVTTGPDPRRPLARVLAPQLERALTASLERELCHGGLPEESLPGRYVYHLGPRLHPSLPDESGPRVPPTPSA